MDLSLSGGQLPLASYFSRGSQSKTSKAKRNSERVTDPGDSPPPRKKGKGSSERRPGHNKESGSQAQGTTCKQLSGQGGSKLPEQGSTDIGDSSAVNKAPGPVDRRGVLSRAQTSADHQKDKDTGESLLPTPPATNPRSRMVDTSRAVPGPVSRSPVTPLSSVGQDLKESYAPMTPKTPSPHRRPAEKHAAPAPTLNQTQGDGTLSPRRTQTTPNKSHSSSEKFALSNPSNTPVRTPFRSPATMRRGDKRSEGSMHPPSSPCSRDFVPSSQTQELTLSKGADFADLSPSTPSRPSLARHSIFFDRDGNEVIATSQSQELELSPFVMTPSRVHSASHDEVVPTSQSSEEELQMWTPTRKRGPWLALSGDSNTLGVVDKAGSFPWTESSWNLGAQEEKEPVSVAQEPPRCPSEDRPRYGTPILNTNPPSLEDGEQASIPEPPISNARASYGIDSQLMSSPLCPPAILGVSFDESSAGESISTSAMPTQLREFRNMFQSVPDCIEDDEEIDRTSPSNHTTSAAAAAPPPKQGHPPPVTGNDSESETEPESDDAPHNPIGGNGPAAVGVSSVENPTAVVALPAAGAPRYCYMPSPTEGETLPSSRIVDDVPEHMAIDDSEVAEDWIPGIDAGASFLGSSQGSSLPPDATEFLAMFSQPASP
ncbi:hypothetical protein IEO21_04546 [Rhodonia placenta]|uniref:Uncharacterized protein n=1 Tax=Rhodonia placenta TaxID=104341 RepID=A0A8H7U357_9APHY|nr:hypothetical protein IEO21_04546 [Postia placenta]